MSKRFLLFVLLSFSLSLLCTPAVVHAQWGPDTLLVPNGWYAQTSFNNARCIASGVGGILHVVWMDRRDGNAEIYYKRSSDQGINWSPDLRLTNNPDSSKFPAVAAAGDDVHIVWIDHRSNTYSIYYKRSSDQGISWSPEVRLSDNTANSSLPTVWSAGPEVHSVWEDWRGSKTQVYYKHSSDGGTTWSSNSSLTSDTLNNVSPSVSSSGSNVHVVWSKRSSVINPGWVYYMHSTDHGTTWTQGIHLPDDTTRTDNPSIWASGSSVHAVWTNWSSYEIYFKRSTDQGSTWSPDARLTYDPSVSENPSVVVSGSNVHVVWDDWRDGSGNYEIYYKCSTDGGGLWTPDTRLTYDPNWSYCPSFTCSDSMLHVVWTDIRSNYVPKIYYKRNPTGNSGVEELSSSHLPPYASRFTVSPNPFTSFATLPGHGREFFALYDISGRRVGVYRGDRIGEGLSPGVYFLKLDGKVAKPFRVVKFR